MSGFDDPGIFYSDSFGGDTAADEGQARKSQLQRRFKEFLRQYRVGTDRTGFTFKYRCGAGGRGAYRPPGVANTGAALLHREPASVEHEWGHGPREAMELVPGPRIGVPTVLHPAAHLWSLVLYVLYLKVTFEWASNSQFELLGSLGSLLRTCYRHWRLVFLRSVSGMS